MRKLYAYIYLIGNKLPKRDKLGLHNYIEKEFLKSFSLLISASLESKVDKIILLKQARLQTETLKQLIRTEYELKIITETIYLQIELKLQEISKMINGWLKYTQTQNPPKQSGLL
ncbi:MAG: four helix bundle protein [Candidatus Nomurabacteria bacterium]|nr:four helix bundle protein [Candidatus Nomurabacteria bacterium]